jgi:hypothetical protein
MFSVLTNPITSYLKQYVELTDISAETDLKHTDILWWTVRLVWRSLQHFMRSCKDSIAALAQAVTSRFPIAGSRFRPSQVMWDLWWAKWHWGRFSPSTSVSTGNPHTTKCSTFINHPRPVRRNGGINTVSNTPTSLSFTWRSQVV